LKQYKKERMDTGVFEDHPTRGKVKEGCFRIPQRRVRSEACWRPGVEDWLVKGKSDQKIRKQLGRQIKDGRKGLLCWRAKKARINLIKGAFVR